MLLLNLLMKSAKHVLTVVLCVLIAALVPLCTMASIKASNAICVVIAVQPLAISLIPHCIVLSSLISGCLLSSACYTVIPFANLLISSVFRMSLCSIGGISYCLRSLYPTINPLAVLWRWMILISAIPKRVKKLNRKARKRGGHAKPGLTDQYVSVLVARDRVKNTFSKVAGLGRATVSTVDRFIGDLLSPENTLCTDGSQPFKAYARRRGINAYGFPAVRVYKGIYHI